MPRGFRNSGCLMLTFNLANESLFMLLASSSFFTISCFFTKLSSSSKAPRERPRSHTNASSASWTRFCERSHVGDSGTIERTMKMNIGKTPASKATTCQWMNVPSTWQSSIPNEIESVIDARRNPLYFGSLQMKTEKRKWKGDHKSQTHLIPNLLPRSQT